MTNEKSPNETNVNVPIRVLYKPLAGKVKRLKGKLDAKGCVTINGGTHKVPQDALFPWHGSTDWCFIKQGQVQAVSLKGTQDALSPEFFNECISNHYASDLRRDLRREAQEEKPDIILYALLGGVAILQLIFGIWILVSLGDITDAVVAALTAAAQGSPPPPVDSTVVHTG